MGRLVGYGQELKFRQFQLKIFNLSKSANSDCFKIRAQTNSGFFYSNILYSQLPNTRIFFFSIGMDEISIILQLYKMSF